MTAQQFQILWPQTHTSRDFRFSGVCVIRCVCSLAFNCSLKRRELRMTPPPHLRVPDAGDRSHRSLRQPKSGTSRSFARTHTHSSECRHPLICVCTGKGKKWILYIPNYFKVCWRNRNLLRCKTSQKNPGCLEGVGDLKNKISAQNKRKKNTI